MKNYKNRVDILYKIITKNGGKVRIFSAINRGPDYGYQYIKISPGKSLQFARDYFDIDLTVSGNALDKEIKKIEYLAALSMLYWTYGSEKTKTNFLFIMKEAEAGISDNSICAFDHHKIYKLSEYYSREGAPGGDGYDLIPITGSFSMIGQYYIGPNNNLDPNEDWEYYKNFYPLNERDFKNNYDNTIWD